ncbi:hypothetical protein CGZ94_20200 [Enemella evansiae]|uniref:Uncharacterized protein n=1 Tax=Enemella evansiae TaxID=2016499 RepID=A0A255FYQ4_9ACTN|nr:hypothetical protein [Enemella evansiae]OYO08820.1 hypothetical protein CGZ94_20200 [Enemella evansiae]
MIEADAIGVGDWIRCLLPSGQVAQGTVTGHRTGALGLLVGREFVPVVQLVGRGRTTRRRIAPQVEVLGHMEALA